MNLSVNDFDSIRKHIFKICGIELGSDKDYLIRQRLTPLAEAYGCKSFADFVSLIDHDPYGQMHDEIIVAITTNETYFFRDIHPFEMFSSFIMPALHNLALNRITRNGARKGSKVSILSAGASTGQEAYSLAMQICEFYKKQPSGAIASCDYEIVGGDISPRVLSKAIGGKYSVAEVNRGLDEPLRSRYFHLDGVNWTASNELRQIVDFRRVNFVEPITHLGGFDCIFCRNMLIYFELETRQRIITQFHRMLSPGGFLVLGATENIYGVNDLFTSKYIGKSSVFIRNG